MWLQQLVGRFTCWENPVYEWLECDCKAIVSIVYVDIKISHYGDFIQVYNQAGQEVKEFR